MKTIQNYIPLITPLDEKLNIDFFSLEKIFYYISGIEKINNLIIFDKFSEVNNINFNDKIDIINCITNNNKANLKIFLKISNLYEYQDLVSRINSNIYKNIYYIIIDYPFFYDYKYVKDIYNNYFNLFRHYKYLYFYFNINNINVIDEKFLFFLKKSSKNFLGIFNETNYLFKSYELVNSIDIIINNDLILLDKIFYNIDGVCSPLFYFLFDYIYRDIILPINNNKKININKIFYNFVNFINILYKKILPITGIKFILNHLNICNAYTKYPIKNIDNINNYKLLIKLLNKIKNN